MNKEIFICGRTYDVYLALVYAFFHNKKIVLVLSKKLVYLEELITELRRSKRVIEIILIPDDGLHENYFYNRNYGKLSVLFNIILLRIRAKRVYGEKYKLEERLKPFLENSTMNLFFVNSALKVYCYEISDNIRFIEEGLGIYSKRFSKSILKLHKLFGLPSYFGEDDKVFEILLSEPDKFNIVNDSKIKKMNLNEMEDSLSCEDRMSILQIFSAYMSFDVVENEKKALIITQPLSEDGHMQEEQKINLYKLIIENICDKHKVYLKKHPREETNYLQYFNQIELIDENLPIDVLNLNSRFKFDIGITVSSTGLNNLKNIEEKIFLVENITNVNFQYNYLERRIVK